MSFEVKSRLVKPAGSDSENFEVECFLLLSCDRPPFEPNLPPHETTTPCQPERRLYAIVIFANADSFRIFYE